LQSRGLARVVGADEDDGASELEIEIVEALEVPQAKTGDHAGSSATADVALTVTRK
jgi:hypothetical protein